MTHVKLKQTLNRCSFAKSENLFHFIMRDTVITQASLRVTIILHRQYSNQSTDCLITARKRSLVQSNVFTPVCQFTGGRVCIRGVCPQGWGESASKGAGEVCIRGERRSASRGSASREVCIGGVPTTTKVGSTNPTGMISF